MTREVTLLGYAAIGLAAIALELRARKGQGTTVAQAIAWTQRRRPTRWILIGGWLWLGWHLFVRVEWR